MTNEKDIARCVLRHQSLQPLHDEAVGEDCVAHLVFVYRNVAIEQIGRLTLRVRDAVSDIINTPAFDPSRNSPRFQKGEETRIFRIAQPAVGIIAAVR